MKKLLIAMFLLLHISTSAAREPGIPLLEIEGAGWTNEEIAYIKNLNRIGSIKIATKVSSAVYHPNPDGSISGFHYNVLKEFADLANINIDIKLVGWNDYFYKENKSLDLVKSDPDYSYVPSLIEQVDLYLDGITSLPWREKMFDIIKFVPSRQMIVTRKDTSLPHISDLNNKVCVMVKNTSMELNLEQVKLRNKIDFSYYYVSDFDEMDKAVSEGLSDFTVYDSDRAFAALKNYKNLTISNAISQPEVMGWAVNKNNKVFKKILEKYLKYALENEILDKYWGISYGVSFVEYLNILQISGLYNENTK